MNDNNENKLNSMIDSIIDIITISLVAYFGHELASASSIL